MGVVQIILTVLLFLSSVVLIVSVVLQDANTSGLSSVMGGNESVFGTKAKGRQAKLGKVTKISAAVFMVICVLLVLI